MQSKAAQQHQLQAMGGKAANLIELRDAGFPVPRFTVLDTSEYFAFVAEHGLNAQIAEALTLPTTAEAADAIRAAFRRPMSAAQRHRVLATAGSLLDGPVAVRSSATAEDQPDASFAGQQDTFLNVQGDDEVLAAVVDCWSSLWTERAITYRARAGVPDDGLGLAVVIQEMVDAEAAGVLFTADPLTGDRRRTVIDGVFGLGEKLVSGQVTPDTFTVETRTGNVLSRTTHGTSPTLTDAQVAELTALGRRIHEHFGQPQDIEWTRVGDTVQIVQSRPITSLYPLPPGPEGAVWLSFGGFQGMLDPLTPLGADLLRLMGNAAAPVFGAKTREFRTNPLLQMGGERLWVRFDRLLTSPAGAAVVKLLGIGDPASSLLLGRLLDEPGFGGEPTVRRRLILRRALHFVGPMLPKVARTMRRPEEARQRFAQLADGLVEELTNQIDGAATEATPAARLTARSNAIGAALTRAFPTLLPAFGPFMGSGIQMMQLLRRLARQAELADSDAVAMRVLRSLPGNVTTEMDLAMWAAAKAIRADQEASRTLETGDPVQLAADYRAGTLPDSAQQALGAFLTRFGMRGVAEIDLGAPRWREEPESVIRTIQTYLTLPADAAPDVVHERGRMAALAAAEEIAGRLPQPKARVARFVAKRLRATFGIRETPKFTLVRLLTAAREALQRSGDELVAAGQLDHRDDVFLLHLDELDQAFDTDLRPLVDERRATRQHELRRRRVPILLLGDGRTFYTAAPEDPDADLSGMGVSPGVVEGLVRIVDHPQESELQPGEILVCRGTDPAWTPLFLTAAGLITEVGGLMTHGSVVAREYGLPAVVGVSEATHRLSTGQRIRIDGGAGTVVILGEDV